jgi:hypothetical protein
LRNPNLAHRSFPRPINFFESILYRSASCERSRFGGVQAI